MKPLKRENSSVSAAADISFSFFHHLAAVTILLFAIFVAFWPALHNGFVNWDDNNLILGTAGYRGLSWSHIRWMFSTFYQEVYTPLSWLSYALDYKLWGLEPFGYHLTNLLLHAANVVLFYFLGMRLLPLAMPEIFKREKKRLVISALFAALVFGLHPLRAESVAWASERRDVLSGFFYLLCILFYLESRAEVTGPTLRKYWLTAAITSCAFSLLSKAMAVSLPLVLIILDIYPLRRLTWDPRQWGLPGRLKIVWEKIPFFIPAFIVGSIRCFNRNRQPEVFTTTLRHYGLSSRLCQAFYGLVFYLWKTLYPFHLLPLHEQPPHPDILHWPYIGCVLLIAAISGLIFALRRRWEAGPALWLYYVVTLAPVLGLIQYGVQMVGDRYSYLPCLGWALLAGAGLGKFLSLGKSRAKNGMVLGGLTLIILGLGDLTWKQTHVWHDSITLWSHVLSLEPNSDLAYNNLGGTFLEAGNAAKAVAEYKKAVALNPSNFQALYNLALTMVKIGKQKQAAAEFRQAISIYPNFADFHFQLGTILMEEGEKRDAAMEYRKAIGLDPIPIAPYINLASILFSEKNLVKAAAVYRQALMVNPNLALAHYGLGVIFTDEGRKNDAIVEFERVLAINPQFNLARQRLFELQRR